MHGLAFRVFIYIIHHLVKDVFRIGIALGSLMFFQLADNIAIVCKDPVPPVTMMGEWVAVKLTWISISSCMTYVRDDVCTLGLFDGIREEWTICSNIRFPSLRTYNHGLVIIVVSNTPSLRILT
uniref:Uncharacterized protein n=1 Tax=uncultured marine thaumarchaeote KM3_200_B02 TaxID=1456093 RepID=A0A075GTW8_9ARCH|nr:hypothetical protein [uncultured marine thaumarchaeote KM3_200_B02]